MAGLILPALTRDGCDEMRQLRLEFAISKVRIVVRGKLVSHAHPRWAAYVRCYKPNIPIAAIEARNNRRGVGADMQQALDYAETLNVPFATSSNGESCVFPRVYADQDCAPIRKPPIQGQQDIKREIHEAMPAPKPPINGLTWGRCAT